MYFILFSAHMAVFLHYSISNSDPTSLVCISVCSMYVAILYGRTIMNIRFLGIDVFVSCNANMCTVHTHNITNSRACMVGLYFLINMRTRLTDCYSYFGWWLMAMKMALWKRWEDGFTKFIPLFWLMERWATLQNLIKLIIHFMPKERIRDRLGKWSHYSYKICTFDTNDDR